MAGSTINFLGIANNIIYTSDIGTVGRVEWTCPSTTAYSGTITIKPAEIPT